MTTRSAFAAIDSRILGLRVDDGEERVLQPAVLTLNREIVLVVDQGRREHFLRQFQKLMTEGARHDAGIFDEIRHLLEEQRFRPNRPG